MTLARWVFPRCGQNKRAGCTLRNPLVPGIKSEQEQQNKFRIPLAEVLMISIGTLPWSVLVRN